MTKKHLFSFSLILLGLACSTAKEDLLPPLPVVKEVNLEQYCGKWFEIVRLPNRFEKDCVGVTAEYGLLPEGRLSVCNSCKKLGPEVELSQAKAVAKIPDLTQPAKLRVSFFWPFYGDYWILELGKNYEYAVVGNPARTLFWILSRTPTMPADQVNEILERFTHQGFDLSAVYHTPQDDLP
jgi:apolipoprotein D and lipocalin family protein